MPLSSASARHSVRTGQPRQMSLARFWAAPWTKSSSGSVPLQAARVVQSVTHMCPTPLDRSLQTRMPEAVFIDGLLPVGVCGHHTTVYHFVTMQLTDSEPLLPSLHRG